MRRLCLSLFAAQIIVASTSFAQSGAGGQSAGDGEAQSPRRPTPQRAPASEDGEWTLFATVSNGLASNVNFDQDDLNSYGRVLAGGVRYAGDTFQFAYELGHHSYTRTSRWDRISQRIEAGFEQDLPGKWDFETVGRFGFKGSSEDRDLVDRDFSITPRLEYSFTPARRLRFFTTHRLKQYDDMPDDNEVRHHVGVEFRETIGLRRHWRAGARFETNDQRLDRGDYRRWTYLLEHLVPVTTRDALAMELRYRLKRYTQRFVEAEDVDVLRTDHQWVPSITWIRSLNHHFEVRFDYTYETTYSNDPEKEYGAHLAWSSVGVRW